MTTLTALSSQTLAESGQSECAQSDDLLRDMSDKIQLLENERTRLHSVPPQSQGRLPISQSMEDGKRLRLMTTQITDLEEENAILKSRINELLQQTIPDPAQPALSVVSDSADAPQEEVSQAAEDDASLRLQHLEAQIALLTTEKDTIEQKITKLEASPILFCTTYQPAPAPTPVPVSRCPLSPPVPKSSPEQDID